MTVDQLVEENLAGVVVGIPLGAGVTGIEQASEYLARDRMALIEHGLPDRVAIGYGALGATVVEDYGAWAADRTTAVYDLAANDAGVAAGAVLGSYATKRAADYLRDALGGGVDTADSVAAAYEDTDLEPPER